jgi:AhpC/TSA family
MRRTVPACTIPWLLFLVCGCTEAPVGFPAEKGQPTAGAIPAHTDWSPTFTDLDGRELKLAGEASVKAIALVFILPECPICNSYIPELNRLHDSFATRGVPIILVHADAGTKADDARQHVREYQIQLPVVMDPDHAWVKRAGATTAPEAAVFSPAGELLYRGRIDNQYAGLGKRRAVVTSHDLQDALEAALAGRPIAVPRTEAIGCLIPETSRGD